MSDSKQTYELLKPGLSYITERTSAFGYSDINGKMQYLQPVSRYKAFNEIKRGEAVSVITKKELEDRSIEVNKWAPENNLEIEFPANPTTSRTETEIVGTESVVKHEQDIYKIEDSIGSYDCVFIKKVDRYYSNFIEDDKISHSLSKTEVSFYKDDNLKKKIEFPLNFEELGKNYDVFKLFSGVEKEEWSNDIINIYVSYTYDSENDKIIRNFYAYSQTKVDEVMNDPDPYVIQTNTKVHERTIGLAMEYAEGYGSVVHVQPYGKFIYDPSYEKENEDYFAGTEESLGKVFDHTGKEYNPGFTYADVGKKVFICFPKDDEKGGKLTVNEEETSKHYHNIICLGYLTDAPQVAGEGKTEIEISISGDQRGLLESTQFEATLGESVVVSKKDPIRVFAVGKESDTKFKARLCFTPQNNRENAFKDTDFIAFQKMDGNTSIIYFTNGDFNIEGVIDDDDMAFIHMAKCYANIKSDGKISTLKVTGLSDLQTTDAVANNIHKFYEDGVVNVLSSAFKNVSGFELDITKTFTGNEPFGFIDMEAVNNGGYYTMYISSGLRSKFDGSITLCNGSSENHGLAVLADIRIPERRDILGIYYGALWDQELENGYTTVFMRMGEFDVPEVSLQQDGNFLPGQEYYLGTNGRVVKYPYNQFDFVSKIGSIKYGNNGDLRFIVDVGESTRHYNGDLPVGYMKPSVSFGTDFKAEYGFLLMDGITTYPKEKPYDALYERLLGWFDPKDVNITGSNMFKVPAVSRTMPMDVEETDENGETVIVQKHVKVPMQIKYLPSGIYEEMPRIPFKRFFGRFQEDSAEKVNGDWTPVKCIIEDCDITDIIDYGISEDGYTKPGLDNLDIHLFIDPDENYTGGAHDWHEVRDGFINWNNSTTFGYTWKIIEEDATLEHPYGSYKLSMSIGNSQGVAYVTAENQAPKKLNGCYYKLYVARREVFARQFDIEKIYKDYLTNSIYTDETKTAGVEDKAVTGKAVLDAIENRSNVKKITGVKGAQIEFGKVGAPVSVLTLNVDGNLPIIATQGITLQNEEDDNLLEESKRAAKIIFNNGILKKGGNYSAENIYEVINGAYSVDENEIPVVGQVRKHAEATIDNKSYVDEYANKDNKHGNVHGMVFGHNGNINASNIWGILPRMAHNKDFASDSFNNDGILGKDVYLPVVYSENDDWVRDVEGLTRYIGTDNKVLANEKIYSGLADLKDSPDKVTSIIDRVDIPGDSIKYFTKAISLNNEVKAQEIYNLDDYSIQFTGYKDKSLTPLTLYAAAFNTASRSEFKRIHGELIRDDELVSSEDLVEGSKKYDNETNKLKGLLGSALQAAYEMPLAYWQYNTEKEWYKDRLGVIVQRVESVAKNIQGKKCATATVGDLIITSNTYGGNDINVTFSLSDDRTKFVVKTEKGSVSFEDTAEYIKDLKDNELVKFSGSPDSKVVPSDIESTLLDSSYVVSLEGGSETGTERKLFDNLYDSNGDDPVNTTPESKAQVEIGNLVIVAKEPGEKGNEIAVSSKYSNDDEHFIVSVFVGTEKKSTYLGKDIDELHTEDYTTNADDPYVEFLKKGDDNTLTSFKKTYLKGGSDGKSVSQNLVNTDYKENKYQYTDAEAESIKEYLTTIIDNSSSGQDIISTVGLLLSAAKETQERLLRVEASTFGRDYETIPGAHEKYKLSGMPGVVADPTNYGLNRLIRAICQELYYDSNPFDSALANGVSDINTSSFSRIDRIDREIHGELNTEDSVQTAPNTLSEIDSSTYPYEDMIRAKDVTEIREAEFTMENYDETAKRGTDVKTRVNMTSYSKNDEGDYTEELDGNTAEKSGQFNGIVDAIYRITTKLNALTESINNSDNIADSPKRLNTIRQNIEHIIREAYFDDAYMIEATGNVEESTPGENSKVEIFENFTKVNAEPYHDVNGPENAPYKKNLSRFDKLTDDLYNYTISLSGEGKASFQNFYELEGEKVLSKEPVRDPETGEVSLVDTEKQVYYTGRKFNGKHLLVDNKPETDGTEDEYTTEIHIPQNLNDYNYASLLDIVVDAIGAEFFRKNVSKKANKDDSWNNRTELRHNRTISDRLDNIEACLDKVVGKLSRKHSFEEETDVFSKSESTSREEGTKGVNAHDTVFSVDRYLQFLNDYLGYSQETTNNIIYGNGEVNNSSNPYSNSYTEHWENGYDYKIEEEPGKADNSGIDETPDSGKEYSAEWALVNKRNIHAGLVNMLSRIQNEETRSSRYDAILGPDFCSTSKELTTQYNDFVKDEENNESSFQTRDSSATYNLTDDIMDVLKTIYGKDNHNELQKHDSGSFTDYTHRTIIKGEETENTNTNVRFATDYTNGKNIIDVMIHDMYFLPQPLRPYDASLGDNAITVANIDYLNGKKAEKATDDKLLLPTDNELLMDETNHGTRDSRLATYYDFDCGKNAYDIPNSENALSWNNREEFFNEIGRFKDSEINDIPSEIAKPHYRLSRFEVIENEIRNLRKLIGLDFGNWNGEDDLVALKFDGTLKFFGDRVNNGFNGNPYAVDTGADKQSYTDQYNQGSGENGLTGKETNILKFILNADKSERLLRTELGFSSDDWAKVHFGTGNEKNTGFWYWYDNTYSNKNEKETFVSSNLKDVATEDTLKAYGLYTQNHDDTYMHRHSVYDRLLALEKNAVQVDAWLDSIKNTYHNDCGKGTGTGNIFDIVSYLGNYSWDSANDYYGEFGKLDIEDIRLSEKENTDVRFGNVTDELSGHHDALKEIFDIIGIDKNVDSADIFVNGSDKNDKERSLEKKKTLWARLNAVETINQHDIDLTNVITTNYTNETGTEDGLVKMTNGKNGFVTDLKTKVLSIEENDKLVKSIGEWEIGIAELIASKGYVDNAIVVAINKYAEETDVGDDKIATVKINGVDIDKDGTVETTTTNDNGTTTTVYNSCDIKDEKSKDASKISLDNFINHKGVEFETLDEQDYYNAGTVNKIVEAINKINAKNQSNVHNVYNNVNKLMNALNYEYNEDLTSVTTGSLIKF